MPTRFDRAMELQEWLDKATPQQVLERLEQAEHEAFQYHVMRMHMDPGHVESLETLSEAMLAGGYRRDAVQAMPTAGLRPGHEGKSSLMQRIKAAIGR